MAKKSRCSSGHILTTFRKSNSFWHLRRIYGQYDQRECGRRFQGTGLVPFDPEAVISKLDVRPRTPTPTGPPDVDLEPWISQTPHNSTEAILQSKFVASMVTNGHQGSSPTDIFSAVKQMATGIEELAHQNTLLMHENRTLRKAG